MIHPALTQQPLWKDREKAGPEGSAWIESRLVFRGVSDSRGPCLHLPPFPVTVFVKRGLLLGMESWLWPWGPGASFVAEATQVTADLPTTPM